MKFEEALKMLKEGKKVRKGDWENEHCYISFNRKGTLSQFGIWDNNHKELGL